MRACCLLARRATSQENLGRTDAVGASSGASGASGVAAGGKDVASRASGDPPLVSCCVEATAPSAAGAGVGGQGAQGSGAGVAMDGIEQGAPAAGTGQSSAQQQETFIRSLFFPFFLWRHDSRGGGAHGIRGRVEQGLSNSRARPFCALNPKP